jgi:hypothetical protein
VSRNASSLRRTGKGPSRDSATAGAADAQNNKGRAQGSDSATIIINDRTERRPIVAYLEGQLRRRTEEAEDEHTGYLLEVEVDMSAVDDVEEVVNGQVAITGEVGFVDYPDRGKILVFKATSAAAVEDEPEEAG